MDRLRRSWQLTKSSWAVLRSDKELLIYPLVSTLLTLVVIAIFAIPFVATNAFSRWSNQQFSPVDLVFLFLFYLATYTIVIFCNSALVAAANIRLQGGDPTLADGFRIASSRLPQIVGYAFIGATIGIVLRMIAERGGILGAIGAAVVGVAWSVVTFLVVPILVIEGVGPIEAIKRSGAMLRKTWGEQLGGNLSIGLIVGLIAVGICIVGGLIVVALFAAVPALGIVAAALLIAALVVIGLIGSALSGIFTVALYRYATTGDAGTYFDAGTVQSAFRPKGR